MLGKAGEASLQSAREQPVVGIQKYDKLSGRGTQASITSRRQTLIVLPDVADAGIVVGYAGYVIRRAIIDHHHFEWYGVLFQHALDRRAEVVGLGVAGNDYGDERRALIHGREIRVKLTTRWRGELAGRAYGRRSLVRKPAPHRRSPHSCATR
jgi:hypothetical protein